MQALWLCVHLHHLALDVVARARERPRCVAVSDAHGSRRWIHDCDPVAQRLGVRAGIGLATAYALAPDLNVYPRHQAAERRALQHAAAWCYRISSRISPQPPDLVLVEIGASERLLGAAERIRPLVREGMAQLGYRSRTAVAPTPAAARLLARAGRYCSIARTEPLPRALAQAPVDACEWPAATTQSLHSMGVHHLGAVLRLPRDGLKRRFGQDLIRYLERVLGRLPEPLPRYRPPERFASTLELPGEVETSEALLFPIQRLLAELEGFLIARDLALERFAIVLAHAHGGHTRIAIGLLEPSRGAARMLELVRERLHSLSLPAPVRAVGLSAGRLFPYQTSPGDLFQIHPEQAHQLSRLLERLRSRLGVDAVFALARHADHRPELAWRRIDPNSASGPAAPVPAGARPLWLLDEPLALAQAPERVLAGPERIESGWWDGRDVSRDYYTAEARPGERLWVFRDRRSRRWYLQGIFG